MQTRARTRALRAAQARCVWALALTLAAPAQVWATPPPAPEATPPSAPAPAAPQWETGDTVLGATVAAGGALLGVGAGLLVGGLAGANLCDANDDGFACLGTAVLGIVVGATVLGYAGSVGGAWLYADEPGLDGRLSGVLIGAAVGEVVGIGTAVGLCQSDSSAVCGLGFALGLAIWGTGAALGYRLSLPDHQVAGAPLGGLIDYDPYAGLRLGAPSADLIAPPPGRGEGFGLTLTLGAGRF